MLIDSFLESLYGKYLWWKIKYTYQIRDTHYLLIATEEEELCRVAMEYLPVFLKNKYATGAVVLLPSTSKIELASEGIVGHKLTMRQIGAIIRFYTLERFSDRVIILSLKEPFGSYGLLNKPGVTLTDLVKNYLLI